MITPTRVALCATAALALVLASSPASAKSPEAAKRGTPKQMRTELRKKAAKEAEEARERRAGFAHRYDEPAEAARYFNETRTPDGETIDIRTRTDQAAAQIASSPVFSTAKGKLLSKKAAVDAVTASTTGWSPLGPGNIGGRTRAFLVHRTQNNLMWVAGVAGGIWKSTDSGATWVPKGDQLYKI
jgi:hypothetical protein